MNGQNSLPSKTCKYICNLCEKAATYTGFGYGILLTTRLRAFSDNSSCFSLKKRFQVNAVAFLEKYNVKLFPNNF